MRNTRIKYILSFVAGAATGIVCSANYIRQYYRNQVDAECEANREYYKAIISDLKKERDELKYAPPKETEIITDDVATTVRITKPKTRKSKKDDAEAEKPEKAPEEVPFKEDYTKYAKVAVEPSEPVIEPVNKGPVIISYNEYLEDRKYEHVQWTYLTDGEIMVDVDGNIVQHPEDYIDNIIAEVIGDKTPDDSEIFIKNDTYGAMYEIEINTVYDYETYISQEL